MSAAAHTVTRMFRTVLPTALGTVVFATLWIANRDELGLPTRRSRRRVEGACAAILLTTCVLVPAAFGEGLSRYVQYVGDQFTRQWRERVVPAIMHNFPSPTVTPTSAGH